MTKDIHTLVDDILGLLDKGHKPSSDLDMTVISRRLEEHLSPRVEGTLRASNIGKKDRQLWYTINKTSLAESLSPLTKMKFLFGDMTEALILWLASESGHKVELAQEEIEVDGIKGHIDAVIDGVIVDVKSTSSQSFKRFTKEDIPNDIFLSNYLYQLAMYSMALSKDAGLLAFDKQLGKLRLVIWTQKELQKLDIKVHIRRIKEVCSSDDAPERCYEPIPEGESGNEKLHVGCQYCSFKHHCWADANDGKGLRTFAYKPRPLDLVKVVKEPRVFEIKNKDIL